MREDPIWRPSAERIAHTNLTRLRDHLRSKYGGDFSTYAALWEWSVARPELFWREIWDFLGIVGELPDTAPTMAPHAEMRKTRFFPETRLNYARNLLRRSDDTPALIFRGDAFRRRTVTWAELDTEVSQTTQWLRANGVGVGDRVAAILPNLPEAITAMLATASIGAIWSSVSPDFGIDAILERFEQISPKVLIGVDGHVQAGRTIECLDTLRQIVAKLPTVEKILVVAYSTDRPNVAGLEHAAVFDEAIGAFRPAPIEFQELPFDHPLFIMYSSGTTGPPKCIVHGAGGALLQHRKEHSLHCDIKPGDRVFYATSTAWMMWNWLVTALAAEATLVLFDGSPVYPKFDTLFEFAAETGITLFGTSANFIRACRAQGLKPKDGFDLARLRTMTSTGSPLLYEDYDYVYGSVKADLHLASISGGTDIISCFVLGDPTAPVWRGEIQARGLGLAVDVFDEDGNPVRGERGELVCRAPFPSMPVGFWNDPDDTKYSAAYFEKFPNVWTHGDWAEITPHDGMIILGRSDTVLKPGGVRIGTAEIYRQVARIEPVEDSIAVGQQFNGDVRIVLFVKMRDGATLDEATIRAIKRQIRGNTSPAHVPDKIIAVSDIPYTRSGKIMETAVRDLIHGEAIKNEKIIRNPVCLSEYRDRPELR